MKRPVWMAMLAMLICTIGVLSMETKTYAQTFDGRTCIALNDADPIAGNYRTVSAGTGLTPINNCGNLSVNTVASFTQLTNAVNPDEILPYMANNNSMAAMCPAVAGANIPQCGFGVILGSNLTVVSTGGLSNTPIGGDSVLANNVVGQADQSFTIVFEDATNNRFTFTLSNNGNLLSAIAISAVVAATQTVATNGTPNTGPTESDLMNDQQDQFTPLLVNAQSNDIGNAINGNITGQFGGNGVVATLDRTGFSMSSTGLARWYDRREKELSAKHRSKAFDLFRQRLEQGHARSRASSEGSGLGVGGAAASYGADLDDEAIDALVPMAAWNAWVKGTWTRYDGDGSSFDGDTMSVIGGVDYRLREDLIVGVLGGYGTADFDTLTGGTRGSFDADGYTIGVYMGQMFGPSLIFDALVAYTASDYDNTVGTTTGSFDADRITTAAHLKGSMEMNGFLVEPTLGFLWASEDQDAYTDSAAVLHASRTVNAGRLSLGPKVYLPEMPTGPAMTQFWFAAFGEYDFSNQGNPANTGLPDIDNVASARLQAGLNATSDTGIIVSLQGDFSGLGSGEYTAYGGTVKVKIPLN